MNFRIFVAFIFYSIFSLFIIKAQEPSPLIIYCRDAFANTWGQSLQQIHGNRIQLHVMSSPGIMTRLRLEQQQTPADLIIGFDSTLVDELQELQIVVKHPYDFAQLVLPTIWPDTALIPVAYGMVSILSHGQDKLNLQTITDIAQRSHQFIIPDPRTSTTGLEFLYWIAETTQAADFWHKFRSMVVTYPKGLSSSFALFMKCKDCLTVAYSTSPHLACQHHDPTAMKVQAEPLASAPMQVYGLLVTTKGQHHPLINAIIACMHSDMIQASIPGYDHLYPVIYRNIERFQDQLPPLPKQIISPPFLTKEQKSLLIEQWLGAMHSVL